LYTDAQPAAKTQPSWRRQMTEKKLKPNAKPIEKITSGFSEEQLL